MDIRKLTNNAHTFLTQTKMARHINTSWKQIIDRLWDFLEPKIIQFRDDPSQTTWEIKLQNDLFGKNGDGIGLIFTKNPKKNEKGEEEDTGAEFDSRKNRIVMYHCLQPLNIIKYNFAHEVVHALQHGLKHLNPDPTWLDDNLDEEKKIKEYLRSYEHEMKRVNPKLLYDPQYQSIKEKALSTLDSNVLFNDLEFYIYVNSPHEVESYLHTIYYDLREDLQKHQAPGTQLQMTPKEYLNNEINNPQKWVASFTEYNRKKAYRVMNQVIQENLASFTGYELP